MNGRRREKGTIR